MEYVSLCFIAIKCEFSLKSWNIIWGGVESQN